MKLLESVMLVSGFVFASPTLAEQVNLPSADVHLVTTAEDRQQVVLRLERPAILDHVSLGEASLRLSADLVSPESELRVQILALREDYQGGGEPSVIEGLVGRFTLERGSAIRKVDLSGLVRGTLHEAQFYGLLVTTPPGVEGGFDESQGQAMLSRLQGSTLDVSFRRTPPPPSIREPQRGRQENR